MSQAAWGITGYVWIRIEKRCLRWRRYSHSETVNGAGASGQVSGVVESFC